MNVVATIISIMCIWYYLIVYVYTWLGMNLLITSILGIACITNFSLFSIFLIVYFMIPTSVMDMWFQSIIQIIRFVHSDFIKKLEGNIRETFQIKVLHPIPERSIRLWSPHGISAVAVGIHNGFQITDEKLTPSKIVTHSGVRYFPIFRDILRQIHCIFSDYGEIKEALKTNSITMVIGGVDEMRRLHNKVIELVITRRKGAFRLALETGTPIVPVITYGEVEVFPESDDQVLARLNTYMFEHFRVSLPFPTFKSLTNWTNLASKPLDPILTYTGRPIYVKKVEHPNEKHISNLRTIYIERMEELFKETNPGDFTLKIV